MVHQMPQRLKVLFHREPKVVANNQENLKLSQVYEKFISFSIKALYKLIYQAGEVPC